MGEDCESQEPEAGDKEGRKNADVNISNRVRHPGRLQLQLGRCLRVHVYGMFILS